MTPGEDAIPEMVAKRPILALVAGRVQTELGKLDDALARVGALELRLAEVEVRVGALEAKRARRKKWASGK